MGDCSGIRTDRKFDVPAVRVAQTLEALEHAEYADDGKAGFTPSELKEARRLLVKLGVLKSGKSISLEALDGVIKDLTGAYKLFDEQCQAGCNRAKSSLRIYLQIDGVQVKSCTEIAKKETAPAKGGYGVTNPFK